MPMQTDHITNPDERLIFQYNELIKLYDLKDTNDYGLSLNHINSDGLCAGLSMLWLVCMANERYSAAHFAIKHFYTKITEKNSKNFLPLTGITRDHFKRISQYINRRVFATNDFYEKEMLKLKNSLHEYHKIANQIFKTNVCGVCSLDKNNNGCDFKEFYNEIIKVKNMDRYLSRFLTQDMPWHYMHEKIIQNWTLMVFMNLFSLIQMTIKAN